MERIGVITNLLYKKDQVTVEVLDEDTDEVFTFCMDADEFDAKLDDAPDCLRWSGGEAEGCPVVFDEETGFFEVDEEQR